MTFNRTDFWIFLEPKRGSKEGLNVRVNARCEKCCRRCTISSSVPNGFPSVFVDKLGDVFSLLCVEQAEDSDGAPDGLPNLTSGASEV